MQEINVKIWRKDGEQDWSVEINGKHHEFVGVEAVKKLVERALINAKESLIEAAARRTQ